MLKNRDNFFIFLRFILLFMIIFAIASVMQAEFFYERFNPFFLIIPFTLSIFIGFIVAKIVILKKELRLANASLESHVAQKTLEISKLNQSLEKRIKNEITLSRQKDKKLIEQSRLALMGEILSMIAHQWKQPLASISTVASYMQVSVQLGEALEPSELKDNLDKIIAYTQHLSDTIKDFKDYYQPTKGRESTNILKIIQESLLVFKDELHNQGVIPEIVFKINTKAMIYHNQLLQVLINLIQNALEKHLQNNTAQPKLIIIASEEKHGYEISVKDNAGGIPKNHLPKIFDPYFSTKEQKNETGLGLYMAKMILERHFSGSLEANNIDEGAIFTLVFPK